MTLFRWTTQSSRSARAEAAAWMAKLHGSQRSTAMEAGWRKWLAEHPDHAAAWELATDTWSETGDLPGVLPMPQPAKKGIAGWRFAGALSTCLIVAALLDLYVERQSVTTAIGEQRTVTLADGTQVELNTSTRLTVRFDDHVRSVAFNSGEAYFNVSHERRPFVVIAGPRKIIAVGTSFLVRREITDDALSVTLIEGRVAIAPTSAADQLPVEPVPNVTILGPGKRLRTARHILPQIDAPKIEKETAWMRGQVIFDNTPLRDAISELNRYNTVKLRVNSEAVGDAPIGGIFRVGDVADFATVVAQAHDLKVITRGREVLLECGAK